MRRTSLLTTLVGVLAVESASATEALPNAVAVVDDLADRIMLFRITDGRYVGDLLRAGEGQLSSPVDCQLARDVRIGAVTHKWALLVSDARQQRIVAYNPMSGAFIGPLANTIVARGLAIAADGRLLVATDTAGVRSVSLNGAAATTVVAPEPVLGPINAWDVLVRSHAPNGGADLLVVDATLDAILRFSPTGERRGVFAKRPEFRHLEQLAERSNGNVLATDALGNAIHEFRADGYWLRAIPIARPRGVAELRNGNLLVACEAGVLELDSLLGTLSNVRFPGYPVSAPRYATRLRYTHVTLLGDMNGDGAVDYFDIDAFVVALLDEIEYETLYPALDPVAAGDADGDGDLDFADIDAFVALLVP